VSSSEVAVSVATAEKRVDEEQNLCYHSIREEDILGCRLGRIPVVQADTKFV
jgi:hypothetical protein